MLRSHNESLDLIKTVKIFSKGIAELEPCLENCLDKESHESLQKRVQAYTDLGLSKEFAQNWLLWDLWLLSLILF